MLFIISPSTFIIVTIFIIIATLTPQIPRKISFKLISIKKNQSPFCFVIFIPISFKNRTFSEEIFSLAMLLSITKFSHILVFVRVLHITDSISTIVSKLSYVNAPISINNLTISLFKIASKFPFINISKHCTTISFSMLFSI